MATTRGYMRLVSGQDALKPPPARATGDEITWKDAIVVEESARGAAAVINVELSGRKAVASRMAEFCRWLLNACAGFRNTSIPHFAIYKVDLSSTGLGNLAAEQLVSTIVKVNPNVRVLKLYANEMSDPAPFTELLARGHLDELHLSNNKLSAAAAAAIIAAASSATDDSNEPLYPRGAVRPLWLRLENNPFRPSDLRAALSAHKLDVKKKICTLDRGSWCSPHACRCLARPPAMHLAYLRLLGLDSKSEGNSPERRLVEPKKRLTTLEVPQRQAVDPPAATPPRTAPWTPAPWWNPGCPEAGVRACSAVPVDEEYPDLLDALVSKRAPRPPPVSRARPAPETPPSPPPNSPHYDVALPCKICTQNYISEAPGYLSVSVGDAVLLCEQEGPSYIQAFSVRFQSYGLLPARAVC